MRYLWQLVLFRNVADNTTIAVIAILFANCRPQLDMDDLFSRDHQPSRVAASQAYTDMLSCIVAAAYIAYLLKYVGRWVETALLSAGCSRSLLSAEFSKRNRGDLTWKPVISVASACRPPR